MNRKRIAIAAVVLLVVSAILDFVVHGIILGPVYEATKELWRPDMEEKMWVWNLLNLMTAILLPIIFAKGYEGKGVVEGVRFGLLIGFLMATSMALGTYGMVAIPESLAVQWFLFGLARYAIFGILLALVYKPKQA